MFNWLENDMMSGYSFAYLSLSNKNQKNASKLFEFSYIFRKMSNWALEKIGYILYHLQFTYIFCFSVNVFRIWIF